jgi:F-type H+-transporting ATPase subunit a
MNIVGLFPFAFSLTTHFSITLTCAIIGFLPGIIIGLHRFLYKILNIFLPSGTVLVLIPLIVGIEILTYFSRIISLSVRLFANMVAGHALLKILASFAVILITMQNFLFILLIIFLVLIFCLEILIAFLQTYVFIILCLIYLNDINSVGSH